MESEAPIVRIKTFLEQHRSTENIFLMLSHSGTRTCLVFRVIWENPAQSHMRKYGLDVPHAAACITYQTLEFPLLISRVHEQVMILFVPLLAACPAGFYGEGCNQTCSCRNDGICHPASGQCVCTPGWTGPNCTEGEFTQQSKVIICTTGKYKVTRWFYQCFFSPQNALQGFMEQTVGSAVCVRMEPPVTRPTENAHVPVDGRAQPVNWVRLRDGVSKSLHMCYHKTTFRWIIYRKILILYKLDPIFVLWAVIHSNTVVRAGNTSIAVAEADGERNTRRSGRSLTV